ncbi:hypothetical protein ACS0PU_011251 [Formica fusca]
MYLATLVIKLLFFLKHPVYGCYIPPSFSTSLVNAATIRHSLFLTLNEAVDERWTASLLMSEEKQKRIVIFVARESRAFVEDPVASAQKYTILALVPFLNARHARFSLPSRLEMRNAESKVCFVAFE